MFIKHCLTFFADHLKQSVNSLGFSLIQIVTFILESIQKLKLLVYLQTTVFRLALFLLVFFFICCRSTRGKCFCLLGMNPIL